jgi:CRP/FNR family transcriptional regulator, cyclic AMP receptor protein
MSSLLALCDDLPIEDVPAGETLITEGSEPTQMYVLRTGSVVITRDDTALARIDSPGAILGEMSVVLGKPATATVVAESDVTVHVVGDPETFLTERPGAALAILRTTAARLDGLTQYLVDVKQQYAGLDGHLGMVDQILDTLVHHQAPAARTGSLRDPDVG